MSAYDIAAVYAGLGEPAGALQWLARARDERSIFFVHLPWDPRFAALHQDPRFQAVVGALALPAAQSVRG